jgi:hypothetical protein
MSAQTDRILRGIALRAAANALRNCGDAATIARIVPETLQASTPNLYAQDGKGAAAVIHFKLFTPSSSLTWYVMEFGISGANGRLTGYGFLFDSRTGEYELGYFDALELAELRAGLGWSVERDLHFKPMTRGELLPLLDKGASV